MHERGRSRRQLALLQTVDSTKPRDAADRVLSPPATWQKVLRRSASFEAEMESFMHSCYGLAADARPAERGARAQTSELPIVALTPGVVARVTAPMVCRSGYSRSVRPTGALWRKLMDQTYDRYGLARGHRSEIDAAGHRQAAFVVDHLLYVL